MAIGTLPNTRDYAQRVCDNLVKISEENFSTLRDRVLSGLPPGVIKRRLRLETLYAYGYLSESQKEEYELYRQLERQNFMLSPLPIDYRLFGDGESNIRIMDSIRQNDFFLLEQAHDRSLEENLESMIEGDNREDLLKILKPLLKNQLPRNVIDTLIMLDASVRSKAKHINLVLPYFPYARGDKIEGRESMTASLFSRLYQEAGVTELITMDLHADQVRGVGDPKIMANENIYMLPLLIDYIYHRILPYLPRDIERVVVLPPDIGAGKLGERYADLLRSELAFAYKRRSYEKGKVDLVERIELLGDVSNSYVIIVDDEIQTGSTQLKLIDKVMEKGAKKISIFVSHGKLTGNAEEMFSRLYAKGEGILDNMVIGDDINHSEDFFIRNPWLHTVDTTGLIADAIYTVHCGTSIQIMYTTQINHSIIKPI